MSGAENERRRLVSALPQARSLANAECLTGTFQASHDGQLQLEQAKDACYLLSGDEAEPDADVDVDEQGDQPIDDDQDGEPEVKRKKKKTKGRVKISMEFIEHKSRRYTTFSKRKTGLMKKAYELATLTGAQVMLLVASETGHVYTFATRKLQSMITSESGKALIQTCLNSPDSPSPATAVQPTSPAPTPAPSTASANCTAGPLPPTGVFQSSANHTGSAYLHASQSQVPMQVQAGNNVAFTPQNAAAFIAKFDDAQFGYEFQPAFAPDDLEANDDSDSQSEAVTAATASRGTTATSRTADSSRYRKIAPSAAGQSLSQSQSKQQQPQQPSRNVVQPNANRSALRLSKPAATHSREVASTSAASGSLQTKFVAVPTFHVTNYNNSPQLDSDG